MSTKDTLRDIIAVIVDALFEGDTFEASDIQPITDRGKDGVTVRMYDDSHWMINVQCVKEAPSREKRA